MLLLHDVAYKVFTQRIEVTAWPFLLVFSYTCNYYSLQSVISFLKSF